MAWRNSPQRWGAFAQGLHWTIAVLIIALALVGLTMDDLATSPTKLKVYALHKSVGLTVLALVLLRLAWRLFDRRPPLPQTMPAWERVAAGVTHGMLYLVMLVMPLSGWLYNSASNFPLRWFGLFRVPALAGPDKALKEFAHEVHETGFYVLAALFALHVAGALKHHFVDRDPTLARMTPGLPSPTQDDP
jgi:cytochrome b561